MKIKPSKKNLRAGLMRLGAIAAMAAVPSIVQAQSADALIDKLVEKGVLTVREANELREEADQNFGQAYAVKSGMPEWVSALRVGGDFRGRFEGFYGANDDFTDRNRFRYRLRFGVVATLFENMEVGLRLTSSEAASGGSFGGDPISGNSTFQDNASKKFVYIDLAYAKWTAVNGPRFSTTLVVGKMENPFLFSDMVFDGDYTPEGAAVQASYAFNDKHVARFAGGGFLVDEIGGDSLDPFWVGAQARFDSTWSRKLQTTAGVAILALQNEENLGANVTTSSTTWTVPNQAAGNTRIPPAEVPGAGWLLAEDFNPVVADIGVTYNLDKFWRYNAIFPIRVVGEVIHNPAADHRNTGWQAGVNFGKSGRRGLWEVSYRYKYLEGDAWYEEFVDSDFGAFYQAGAPFTANASGYISGTNAKGHIVRASYSPVNSLTLGTTVFLTEAIDESPEDSESGMTRLQVDAMWKF